LHATDGAALMVDKSSEAYGEKGYKLGNHLFHTPAKTMFYTLSGSEFAYLTTSLKTPFSYHETAKICTILFWSQLSSAFQIFRNAVT
jgi:hypothetical protein